VRPVTERQHHAAITCSWTAVPAPRTLRLLCRHCACCKEGLMALLRREFTLNMISEWFIEAANHTCAAHAVCLSQLSDLVLDCINVTLANVRTRHNQYSVQG